MSAATTFVPIYLRNHPNFVVWKYKQVEGRKTKIPFSPTTHKQASTTNPLNWSELHVAREASTSGAFNGIGFVFSDHDDVVGIDIDHCVDPDTQEIKPWARRIMDALCSYTEYSPSLSGLHIFIRASAFGSPNQINVIPGSKIEMYWKARFFTLTGTRVDGTPADVEERHQEFKKVYDELVADAKIIEQLKKHDDDGKTWKLWEGDWADNYNSQSEADLALVSVLMWLCDGEDAKVDRIFRYSALWRAKWDEQRGSKTYGEKTLELARTSYDARFKALASGIDPQYTDYGNALRMWKAHHQDLFYVPTYGKWYVWRNTHWAVDTSLEASRYAHKTVQDIYGEAAVETDRQRRADLIEHARRSEMGPRLREMEGIAKGIMAVSQEDLDTDPFLLNVKNGTLDLSTGDLLPHSRDRMLTKLAPVVYNPEATCPTWDAFLKDIFQGDDDLISFVQRAVGYSLTGSAREQAFFFLYGVGSNGKSTFLTTVRSIIGDYAAQADPGTFMAQGRNDGPRNDLARLVGKRFVTSIETDEGKRFSESLMKQLTGGEAITCRFLHQEFFEYVPTYKIWVAGNHMPDVRGQDHGFWRRVRLVPFTVTIPDERQDRTLPAKLAEELSGVLNWALEGMRLWREHGLGTSRAVSSATSEYRAESDTVGMFLADAVEKTEDPAALDATCANVYEAYVFWSQQGKEFILNKRKFEKRLRESGLITGRGSHNVMYWVGIELRDGYKASDIASQGRRPAGDDSYTPDELF